MNLSQYKTKTGELFVGHTIALVDDDRNILTSVTMALEAEGFNVRTFRDGDSALHGLSVRSVDLAILDIKCPEWMEWSLSSVCENRAICPSFF